MKETARDRLMFQTGRAEECLKVINQYVENHGNVHPDQVNWNDVGTMAEVASKLQELARFIQS